MPTEPEPRASDQIIRADVRQAALYAFAVLVSRVAILGLLAWFVHHREFTDDVTMHMDMAHSPMGPLLGRTVAPSHPPFMSLLLSLVAAPLSVVMSDFLAMRLTSIVYEAAAAFVFGLLATHVYGLRLFWSPASLAFLAMPMGWMTTAVMAQDESIGALFVMAVVWLTARGQADAALVTCGLAVSAAKIFMLGPLAALVILLPHRTLIHRAMLGGIPALVPYAWVYGATMLSGNPMPLVDFTPSAQYSVNLWVMLAGEHGMHHETARRLSSVLVAAALGSILAARLMRPKPLPARSTALLLAVPLLWIFALFYHVSPEYYILALPPLLLVCRSPGAAILISAISAAPWGVNLVYGVRQAIASGAAEGSGKAAFVHMYRAVVPVEPDLVFYPVVAVSIVSTLGLTLWATRRLLSGEEP
ncbi:MAG: hypothetical protein ACREAA_06465 [Candidatus Polarisedimenticolia bacterium]